MCQNLKTKVKAKLKNNRMLTKLKLWHKSKTKILTELKKNLESLKTEMQILERKKRRKKSRNKCFAQKSLIIGTT